MSDRATQQRIQTTQIHPNGMPLQNTYLTGRIKIVANDGLLKWPQTLSKEAGHPTRMKSSSRVLNDMELGQTSMKLAQALDADWWLLIRWSLVASMVQTRNSDRKSSDSLSLLLCH